MNAHILAPWCRPSLLLDRFQTEKNECPVAEIFCGQGGRDSDLFPVALRLYTLLSHIKASLINSNQWRKGPGLNKGNTFQRYSTLTHLGTYHKRYIILANKQERKCSLRCVGAIIVTVEKQYVLLNLSVYL